MSTAWSLWLGSSVASINLSIACGSSGSWVGVNWGDTGMVDFCWVAKNTPTAALTIIIRATIDLT